VIFLTALHGFESESFGLALGAADYITKPINLEITRWCHAWTRGSSFSLRLTAC
jgi:DNA-binding response OmpR family regulator